MTTEQNSNRVKFLQYLNTIILTVIGIFAIMIFTTVRSVRQDQTLLKATQEEYGKELLRLKTVQDINVAAIKDVASRISTLELNYLDYIKNWVDANYLRKPQK
jgi:hypothetical protein